MLKTQRQLSLRAKTIISLACFAVVFAGLTVIATFYDLQISRLLTKHSLVEPAFGQAHGSYISYNGFALFFEALGSCPIYLMASVVGAIVFWFFARKEGKLRFVAILGVVAAVAGFTLTIKDLFGYAGEYIGSQLTTDSRWVLAAHEAGGAGYIVALSVVLALFPAAGLLFAWQRIPKAVNDKMIWWAFAILGTIVFYLVPHFIKGPVGRVRYRTMNYLNDFSLFTRWYQLNGKRVLTAAGVVDSNPQTKAAIVVASDACKSFPSGHTFSAGLVYTLLALPYLSDKCNKTGVKIGLWVGTVGYTGIVAVSRIVAGAHFMSDVLFGGTIAFAGAMIMREIFVCKGAHVKALFGKAKVAEAVADAEPVAAEAIVADSEQPDVAGGEE